jgi:hypothetical protein
MDRVVGVNSGPQQVPQRKVDQEVLFQPAAGDLLAFVKKGRNQIAQGHVSASLLSSFHLLPPSINGTSNVQSSNKATLSQTG